MPRIQTTGVCRACNERLAGTVIGRHLSKCPKRQAGGSPCFDLRVYSGPFWLYLEAHKKATLKDLDALLRRVWVECCGHLSAFEIDGRRYQAQTGGVDNIWVGLLRPEPDRGMGVRLDQVFRPGLKASYEYDFGTTTRLDLRVLAERPGSGGKDPVRILARNDPPQFPCGTCGKPPAKTICTECQTALCAACLKAHECDEEMQLPLVNSPRAGACGYTGSPEDEEVA